VVAGGYGLACSWRIPFVRQIRPDSTSAGRGLPNRPVRCLRLPHLAAPPLPGPCLAGRQAQRDRL
jgi:hypothetical protein